MDSRRHLLPAIAASLLLAAPAAVAALPGGAKYVGTTSDGNAVALKLSGQGVDEDGARQVLAEGDGQGAGRQEAHLQDRPADLERQAAEVVPGPTSGGRVCPRAPPPTARMRVRREADERRARLPPRSAADGAHEGQARGRRAAGAFGYAGGSHAFSRSRDVHPAGS